MCFRFKLSNEQLLFFREKRLGEYKLNFRATKVNRHNNLPERKIPTNLNPELGKVYRNVIK